MTLIDGSSAGTSGGIQHRKSVVTLSAGDLAALRAAFSAVMGISDERGYQHHAGIHGLPLPGYCVHHDAAGLLGNSTVGPLFLPWHRAYLYFFEQALQDQVPGVTLPWWDWATDPSQQSVVPDAYTVETVDGQANPLSTGPIVAIPDDQWSGVRDSLKEQTGVDPGALPASTFRQPGALPGAPPRLPTPQDVARVLAAPTFVDFTQKVERIHDGIHVWVGGTMSEIPVAAYDPLFWAHHTMIDRLWSIWQQEHPGAHPPNRYLGAPIAPFPSLVVRDTLEINSLGYEYALAEVTVQPAPPAFEPAGAP